MPDVRAKGRDGEIKVRDMLRKHTGLKWERVPLSGALEYLKGDLYVPNEKMLYSVEVKNYKESSINHLLISGKPIISSWWEQTLNGTLPGQESVLFFKHNRSKIFCMIENMPLNVENFMFLNHWNTSIMLAEDWLIHDEPEFIK